MVTVSQATAAAPIAAQIASLNTTITAIEAALAAGASIQNAVITLSNGNQLTLNTPMSPADTAALLNGALAVFQADVAALTAELAAI